MYLLFCNVQCYNHYIVKFAKIKKTVVKKNEGNVQFLDSVKGNSIFSFLFFCTGVAVGVETHVNVGDSLTINCSSTANTTGIHIWWFNDKIIFADKFAPLDIGVKNVRGDFKNGTSYLHFTRLTVRNAGNYSCSVGVTENCFYTLSVSGKFLFELKGDRKVHKHQDPYLMAS
ncbi:hypothetical protein HOLleu_09475 [Holothuria leucospilota]|uniref:Ig-like domain-containing protein n=1 Tax=Holothuria leucospilota TaxID=206669 RepID=A0A9Q1HE59_HOLLE|nr:hypothetical protein HOLleu_09475 [Holothuria leucospilota]